MLRGAIEAAEESDAEAQRPFRGHKEIRDLLAGLRPGLSHVGSSAVGAFYLSDSGEIGEPAVLAARPGLEEGVVGQVGRSRLAP
ncbi:hypothetical protein GCM10009558_034210 [Virgisporangium aurantiacum]